eukprot:3361513-Prymnesium_polylepis.1
MPKLTSYSCTRESRRTLVYLPKYFRVASKVRTLCRTTPTSCQRHHRARIALDTASRRTMGHRPPWHTLIIESFCGKIICLSEHAEYNLREAKDHANPTRSDRVAARSARASN